MKHLEGEDLDKVLDYLDKLSDDFTPNSIVGVLSSHLVALVYTTGIPMEAYVNGLVQSYNAVVSAHTPEPEPEKSNIVLLNPLGPVKI